MKDQDMKMSCPKCRVPMTFRTLQNVDDPRRGAVELEVYECPLCHRFSAEAVAEPALH